MDGNIDTGVVESTAVTEVVDTPVTSEPVGSGDSASSTAATQSNADNQPIAKAVTPRGTVLQLVEDPITGRKKLSEVAVVAPNTGSGGSSTDNDNDGDAGEVDSQGNTGDQTQQGLVPNANQTQAATTTMTAPQANGYSPEEFSVALQLGTVDESRLSGQMAIDYGRYKERIAQQQTANQPNDQGNKQVDDKAARTEFLRKVNEAAQHVAMQELGLTKDDLIATEYSDDASLRERIALYNTAVESNRQRILAELEAERTQSVIAQNNQKVLLDSVATFADAEAVKEPKYNEINKKMLSYYQELPFEKGKKYYEAALAYQSGKITNAQLKDLEEYYNETKKAVYAMSNNLSATPQKVIKKPPVVERPGTGANIERKADPSQLATMNVRQRKAWFEANFK